ncbi:hypothetical protein GCM10009682_56610 [Luedemannella flava]|uniref:Lipoprotein n=1 Tax=Luedemannella flava TaxID=349316 RepID=A0ABP4YUJ7_9ACTN
MRRRLPPRLALAAAALPLILVAAGCAGENKSPKVASVGGTASAAATVDPELAGLDEKEKALKFAQCMRDNGVPMEDPKFGEGGEMTIAISGEGLDKATIDAAQEKCKKYAPMGPGSGGKVDPKMQENMLKMAQCMRENGVENFPDPKEGGIQIDGSIAEDPDFKAADEKCHKLYGPPGGGDRKLSTNGGGE